jgi:hypothetical protein
MPASQTLQLIYRLKQLVFQLCFFLKQAPNVGKVGAQLKEQPNQHPDYKVGANLHAKQQNCYCQDHADQVAHHDQFVCFAVCQAFAFSDGVVDQPVVKGADSAAGQGSKCQLLLVNQDEDARKNYCSYNNCPKAFIPIKRLVGKVHVQSSLGLELSFSFPKRRISLIKP